MTSGSDNSGPRVSIWPEPPFSDGRMPLPFLLGHLAACPVTALIGAQLPVPPTRWRNGIRQLLGVATRPLVSPSPKGQLPQTLESGILVQIFVLTLLQLG